MENKRHSEIESEPLKVVIIDDHPMVRDGLAVMLEARRLAKVVAKVPDMKQAVMAIHKLGEPDVVLSDVRMPENDGFATLARLHRFWPSLRVLLLAGMPLNDEVERARKEGAAGYLPKSCDMDVLADAIRTVAKDKTAFVCETFAPPPSKLSPRETDVLKYLAEGKTREEIAIILGIGFETVKARTKTLMHKLDVTNSAAAVHRAHELGLLR